jgi:hypothetical protein
MLDALTKAEELITHTIGDTPEARETLRAIKRARRAYLVEAMRQAEYVGDIAAASLISEALRAEEDE